MSGSAIGSAMPDPVRCIQVAAVCVARRGSRCLALGCHPSSGYRLELVLEVASACVGRHRSEGRCHQ
eukprot:2982319-Rhodomonas_salina.1